jgi:hypothetical protein
MTSIRRPNSLQLLSRDAAMRLGTVAVVSLMLSACVVAPAHRVEPVRAYRTAPEPVGPAMYFYPNDGQSPERQDRDRFECYQWAKHQTGTDPGMAPVSRPLVQPAPVPGAGAAVGGVTGAVIGAAVASPRHVGEGLVLGAVLGTLIGAASDQQRAVDQAQADAARNQRGRAYDMSGFRRAMSACMTARRYTIG